MNWDAGQTQISDDNKIAIKNFIANAPPKSRLTIVSHATVSELAFQRGVQVRTVAILAGFPITRTYVRYATHTGQNGVELELRP
jgi:hypothetical protein